MNSSHALVCLSFRQNLKLIDLASQKSILFFYLKKEKILIRIEVHFYNNTNNPRSITEYSALILVLSNTFKLSFTFSLTI